MNNLEMIDSLIVDCNELPKALMNGQFVLFCAKIAEMVKKLANLKDGVKTDTESLHKQIMDLNEEINTLSNQLFQHEKGES